MATHDDRPRLTRRQAAALLLAPLAAGLPASAAAGKRNVRMPTRGFNLTDWVDHSKGTAPAGSVLDKLHALGFETVRLPVSADLINAESRTDAQAELGRIDAAVGTLLRHGFSVILDMHTAGRLAAALRKDPAAGGKLADKAWHRLAGVLAGLPAGSVYAELLNEPPLARAAWLDLRERLAATVRTRCPRHTLIWGPTQDQGIWRLADTPPLADGNAIAAVHYYFPMGFTHQCETWDPSPLARISGLPFPATRNTPAIAELTAKFRAAGDEQALAFLDHEFQGPWSNAHIDKDFATLGRWSRKHRCPVILDEFGVLNFCVDAESRARWTGAVRRAAAKNGAGWVYWELDQGFGFIKSRKTTRGFENTMIDAMMGS